jgi:hypothetical protein
LDDKEAKGRFSFREFLHWTSSRTWWAEEENHSMGLSSKKIRRFKLQSHGAILPQYERKEESDLNSAFC